MSNEKHDEFSSWRSLLGSRDALPEHGLDSRDRSWEKLNSRLRPEPVSRLPRRHSIYWITAAGLLLMLVPAALFLPVKHKSPPPARPGAVAPPAIHPAEGEVVFRTSPPADETVHPRTVNRRPRTLSTRPTPPPPASTIPASTLAPAPSSTLAPAPASTLASVPPSTTPSTPLVAALPPDSNRKRLITKQLRVVHINEIDNPIHSQPAMTSTFKHSGEPDLRIEILLKTRQ